MSGQGKISANVQGAFVGALLGFLCSEAALQPSLWRDFGLGKLLFLDALWGMAFAVWLGIGLGIVEGVVDRSWGKARRGLILGAALGLGAGMVGVPAAELFYQWGISLGQGGVLPRALGWAIMGAAVGIVQGAARNSASTAWHGLFGGMMGGALGGVVFEIVAGHSRSEIVARLMGLLAIGVAEGFAVGLVQEALKQAWLTSVSGKTEGRTYFLDKPMTTIGSHELCDIKIFEDPSVAPVQAQVREKGGVYEVTDVAGNGRVAVNLKPAQSAALGDGFLLQVGGQRFVMQIRGALAPLPQLASPADRGQGQAAPVKAGQAAAVPNLGEGICEFCGGRKDPVTGACACTPGATETRDAGNVRAGTSANGPLLVGVGGTVAGKQFRFVRSMLLVGRHSDNDVVLTDDPTVSRFHARLTRETEGMTIYDEGSSNGTFVNGERVYRRLLHSGDVITLGQVSFRFEEIGNGGTR